MFLKTYEKYMKLKTILTKGETGNILIKLLFVFIDNIIYQL